MTNHSETTGPSENAGFPEPDRHRPAGPAPAEPPARSGSAPGPGGGGADRAWRPEDISCTAYESHGDGHQVTLRTPAELADALPYLLGYRPEDSIVLVSLHDMDGRGRFGGRARLGIPAGTDDWPSAARRLVHGLVSGSEHRGTRPEQMVVFLCHEPGSGESGRQVKERLGPLAHALRIECGALDIPVVEALCISDGRFWSYCCDDEGCCPAEGTAMGLPGTSVLAAAATYAGLQVRGTLRELRARLLPREDSTVEAQRKALDAAGMTLVPRILDAAGRHEVAEEALALAGRLMDRLAGAPSAPGTLPADLRDDDLLADDEAATLILGLQDRTTRDRAAEWMEGSEAGPALRLWRALARRCVGPYGEHAAAPLTLAGWVAWSAGDELEAREAFAMALGADPDYLFARLLHQACNEGLDPESVRRCLRTEREGRGLPETDRNGTAAVAVRSPGGRGDREPLPAEPAEPAEPADPADPAESDASADPVGPVGPVGPFEAAEPTSPGPRPRPWPRRSRTRAADTGGGSPRVRTQKAGPGARLPYPRVSAGGTRPRGSAPGGARPGGADDRRTRPGEVRSGLARPVDEGGDGVPRGRGRSGGHGIGGEE